MIRYKKQNFCKVDPLVVSPKLMYVTDPTLTVYELSADLLCRRNTIFCVEEIQFKKNKKKTAHLTN